MLRFIAVSITIMVASTVCRAGDSEFDGRKSLTGITAVEVVVERLPPGAAAIGLTKESIQTDVELKLRLAGMRVVANMLEPYVYVAVNMTDDGRAADVHVSLNQVVKLKRDPTIHTVADTWSVSTSRGSIVLT